MSGDAAWERYKAHLPAICEQCRRLGSLYEFDSFLVGCRNAKSIAPGSLPEEGARYFKRAVGLFLDRLWPHRAVDFSRPVACFAIDPPAGTVEIDVLAEFVLGRYRKNTRDMPQSRWPCRVCGGGGCERCGGTGVRYAESVQECIAAPFLDATGGIATRFHGMGREDIDARMLGSGRPFVLEIEQPRRRSIDWAAAAADVAQRSRGRVEMIDAARGTRTDVEQTKNARHDKSYRARVVADCDWPDDLHDRVAALQGRTIRQRTPARVTRRRTDLERHRRVRTFRVEEREGREIVIVVRGSAGLYIKELVSGDDGRTRPSLAELANVTCRVSELDVIAIHDDERALLSDET